MGGGDQILFAVGVRRYMSVCTEANLIQNSPDLSRRFGDRVRALEDNEVSGARIKNLRFCKPRFNSAQAPLSRIVLYFDAILGVAVEISAIRNDDAPGRIAKDFLSYIDEEVALQAAMMADAGDQNLEITRLASDYLHKVCVASI